MSALGIRDFHDYVAALNRFINTIVLQEPRDGELARIRSAELRKVNRP